MFKSLRKVRFNAIDPLGDGLREAIEAERREPEAIDLEEHIDEDSLLKYLNLVTQDEEAIS